MTQREDNEMQRMSMKDRSEIAAGISRQVGKDMKIKSVSSDCFWALYTTLLSEHTAYE